MVPTELRAHEVVGRPGKERLLQPVATGEVPPTAVVIYPLGGGDYFQGS